MLALNPTPVLPLPEEVLRRAQARVLEALAAFPYLGKVLGPEDIRALSAQDTLTISNYVTLSDFVSVLDITDREMLRAVTDKQPADLVFSLQVLDLNCPNCEQTDRVGIVASFLDGKTAEVLWRIHLTEPVSHGAEKAEISEEADYLTGQLIEALDDLLKPKWHRQRFNHLRSARAG